MPGTIALASDGSTLDNRLYQGYRCGWQPGSTGLSGAGDLAVVALATWHALPLPVKVGLPSGSCDAAAL